MCKPYRKVSRGQVWFLVDQDVPAVHYKDSIQGKNRPWLIVSNDTCNQSSTIYTVVPLTTACKSNLPVHVQYNDNDKLQTVLCEQLRSVPERLFFNSGSYYKYTLSDEIMRQVDEALSVQLGLSLLMPNSERFWSSVEQMIRIKVKESIKSAKVESIDISKISTMLLNSVDTEIKIAEDEDMKAIEQPIVIPNDAPKSNLAEQFVAKLEAPKRKLNTWTAEMKKDFCDVYYKHGPQAAANKYNVKLGSAYRLKWNFEKELQKDATTGK